MPLWKDVQLRYGASLEQEHLNKHREVAALEDEARETSHAAALKVAQCRAEAQRAILEVERSAEQRVKECELARKQLLEQHRRQMRKIEEHIGLESAAADQRIRKIEDETRDLYDQCEADIRRINAECDVLTRAARERCAEAEQMGDEAAREAEQYERDIMVEARTAQAAEEKRRVWRVTGAEKQCEMWRQHCEEAVTSSQRRVAERIKELLAEASIARESLEHNRSRVDAHLEHDLHTRQEVTAEELGHAELFLAEARQQLRDAKATAGTTASAAIQTCQSLARQQVSKLHEVADRMEEVALKTSKLEALDMPHYIRGLEELVARLRSGRFSSELPPQPQLPPA